MYPMLRFDTSVLLYLVLKPKFTFLFLPSNYSIVVIWKSLLLDCCLSIKCKRKYTSLLLLLVYYKSSTSMASLSLSHPLLWLWTCKLVEILSRHACTHVRKQTRKERSNHDKMHPTVSEWDAFHVTPDYLADKMHSTVAEWDAFHVPPDYLAPFFFFTDKIH